MNTKKLLLTFAILIIALISGCAEDNFIETEGVCPVVISTIPLNGALGVPLRQIISATFNEEMNPTTINAATFIVTEANGTVVTGAVTYSGTTATFTPSSFLKPNTTYIGRIKTGAKDVMGNALQTDYVWTFSTGMLIVPTVITTDPANNATNVPLNKTITATFSMPMDPLTLNNFTFIVNQGTNSVAGTITYAGSMVSFTPTAPLTSNTIYTVTITNGAKNLDGTPLASNYVWKFTTEAPPTVTATDPTNNATGVSLNKIVTATFSVPMDPLTLNSTTFIVKHGTFTVPGVITYAGSTVSFTATNGYVANNEYTVTITTGAKSVSGLPLASNYVWKFTTAVAPTVIATDPLNNATGINLNKTVTATFSTVMDPLTITGTTFTLKQGTTVIAGVVSYTGSTASFKPTNALLEGKIYTATITTGAKSAAGVPLANDYVWNFTTLVSNAPAPTTGLFFGVFGGNAGITNQGLNTRINNGGIGTTAASTLITGFTDKLASPDEVYTVTPLNNGLVFGGIYTDAPPPGNALKAQKALEGLNEARALWNSISPAAKPGGSDQGSGELGGLTLAAGVYKSASGTYKITNGDLTLSGSATDVWIFQAEASLTVGSPAATRNVKLIGGALAKNVYWYVGSAAVINYAGGGIMTGNIIAEDGVTLSSPGSSTTLPGQETVLNGRAISLIASVTMVNTIINVPAN
ncbi:Ig-like domain-containing protein [Flavobacterium xueshanense]|uniref:Ig-like domain-containing protein n=1 Tax=Flavobacterium xueshanense TaxID=935223 RepID=A0A1I2IFU6_9FLAO|nr:Ig-like domain-containing protein [Flavobacterium xueshanense]SFF39421.1 Ig-like domain-containing protein [Flavobacterium xueshanense]